MPNPSASEKSLPLRLSDTQLDEIMRLASRSPRTVATRCCASWPISYVVAAMSATASYIGLRAPSSRTIACSTRRISTAACRASASGSGEQAVGLGIPVRRVLW